MIGKPTDTSLHRILSEFLAYALLRRARAYRRMYPQVAVLSHDFIGTEINVYGRYEDRELRVLSGVISNLDRSKLVLDVGANIGNHTLFFMQSGFERIHAFEPNPRTFQLLQFNTDRYPQITAHQFGLSSKDAVLDAAIPLSNAGGGSLQQKHQESQMNVERVSFKVRRYDGLELMSEPVGLLKIDIEGHEAEAIEGMRSMLMRDKPLAIFECNRRTEQDSADRMISMLREVGYGNFFAIAPLASAVPQNVPSMLRRPLRLIERLISKKVSEHKIIPITCFDDQNYPMVVASVEPLFQSH